MVKFIKIGRDFFKNFKYEVKVDVQPKEVCVCGGERSWIYPRDCAKCGALFVPKTN